MAGMRLLALGDEVLGNEVLGDGVLGDEVFGAVELGDVTDDFGGERRFESVIGGEGVHDEGLPGGNSPLPNLFERIDLPEQQPATYEGEHDNSFPSIPAIWYQTIGEAPPQQKMNVGLPNTTPMPAISGQASSFLQRNDPLGPQQEMNVDLPNTLPMPAMPGQGSSFLQQYGPLGPQQTSGDHRNTWAQRCDRYANQQYANQQSSSPAEQSMSLFGTPRQQPQPGQLAGMPYSHSNPYLNAHTSQQTPNGGALAYVQQLSSYLWQREYGVPQSETYDHTSTSQAMPPPASYMGHSHSHPGATISYGPTPPPASMQHPSVSLATSAASPYSSGNAASAAVNPRPQTLNQDTVPAIAGGRRSSFHQHQPYIDSSVPLTCPAPTIEMYNFVHKIWTTYAGYMPALWPFNRLSVNFRAQRIGAEKFYIGVYKILYRTGAKDLLQEFQGFVPGSWKEVDLAWYNRAIEQDFDDELVEQAQERILMESQSLTGEEVDRVEARAWQAKAASMAEGKQGHETSDPLAAPEVQKQMIVRLKVGRPALQALEYTEATQLPVTTSGSMQPHTPKKKVPVRGFRAGEGDVGTPAAVADLDTPAQQTISADSSPLSSLPSALSTAPETKVSENIQPAELPRSVPGNAATKKPKRGPTIDADKVPKRKSVEKAKGKQTQQATPAKRKVVTAGLEDSAKPPKRHYAVAGPD